MLGETYSRLRQPQTDQVVVNALIESFCIHARLLLEFFGSEGHPEAVKAREFTGGEYQPAYMAAVSKTLRKKLHQQIAHLSESRTDLSDEKIGATDRTLLHTVLLQEFVHFSSMLLPEFKGPLDREHPPGGVGRNS